MRLLRTCAPALTLILALAAARPAQATEDEPPTPVADTPTAPAQTPAEAMSDFDRLRGQQLALLPERDAANVPTFYYGRVFVRQPRELGALDLLHFRHSRQPYFDEYNPNQMGHLDVGNYQGGYWEYAIATGVQWNILIKVTGTVSAIDLNPRLDKFRPVHTPHPVLDSFLRADGSLDPRRLAEAGFTLEPIHLRDTCESGSPGGARGFFDFVEDAVDAIGDAISDAADFIANRIKELGGTIGDVLQKAAQGISDAIDFIRELANTGICALTGKRGNSGQVFVIDPATGNPVVSYVGPDKGRPEPIRNARMRARGGPIGLLHTEAAIGSDGWYHFDDLCGDIEYTLSVELDTPWMWVTYNGFLTDTLDVGRVGRSDGESKWVANAPSVRWLIGAQLAARFAPQFYGIYPRKAKMILGFPADGLIGAVNGHTTTTICGQARILGGILTAALPAGALTNAILDGDIYGMSRSSDRSDSVGIAVHEYGHFLMCEAIRQNGGDLDGYMNKYTMLTLTNPDNEKFQKHPTRNSAESIADYLTFHVFGYTNYFGAKDNASGGGYCDSGSSSCLENDVTFARPADNDPGYSKKLMGSRASIMYDWTDSNWQDLGFARIMGWNPQRADDDHMSIPASAVAYAMAHVGNDVSTENMASFIASNASLGRPADAVCEIFTSHGWSCNGLSIAGATLTAPSHFDGRALATNQIRWRWIPGSSLASTYAVVDPSRGVVGQVAASETEVTATYAGVAPNTRIVAYVEARRDGATPGRSVRQARCTLAAAVDPPRLTNVPGGLLVEWPADAATDYIVQRADGLGAFAPLATVGRSGGMSSYLDRTGAPGLVYRYRVDARNCDAVSVAGRTAQADVAVNDANFVFVRAGAASGNGSRALPFASINQALALLGPNRNRILVAGGTYPERVTFDAGASVDVAVFGGYDPTFRVFDPASNPVLVTGDQSSWDATFGSGEFRSWNHPMFRVASGRVSLSNLRVLPVSITCDPARHDMWACQPLGLAAVHSPGSLSLRNVEYRGVASSQTPWSPFPILYCTGTCTVTDSVIDAPPYSGIVAINAVNPKVAGSLIVAGNAGIGILAAQPEVIRSVVRGSRSDWTASGSVGIRTSYAARVQNSLVAGEIAIQETRFASSDPPEPGTFGSDPGPPSLLVNNVLYGRTVVALAQIVNNALINNSSTVLKVTMSGSHVSGYQIRNNLFVTLGSAAVAETVQRSQVGLGPLNAQDSGTLNRSNEWFRSNANRIEGNLRFSTLGSFFDAGQVSASPGATADGHSFHPLPGELRRGGSVAELGVGTPGELDIDLDGTARPFGRDIGPYDVPPTGCQPLTCADQGARCGRASNGCGGFLQCGGCASPSICGGDGVANQCSVN